MDYLQVFLTTLLSVVVLFIITRILGYRQLSELSLFDYVNGITIGSIAAELATAEKGEILQITIAMVLYGIATLILALVTDKSMAARRFITGKPIVLFENGKLCYENFKKARLDVNEFLMKCRNNGYFDLTQINTAILEPNGRVSFIPSANNKPVTVSDIGVLVEQERLVANVIIDGKIIQSSLDAMGKDKNWLLTTLRRQGSDNIGEIFLATCDSNFNLTCYKKSKAKPKDMLE